jgi:hypothetical protein
VESWGRFLRSAECLSRLVGIYRCGGNDGGWVYLFFTLLLSLSTACSWLDGNSTVNCLQTRLEIFCMGKLGFNLFSVLFLDREACASTNA